MLFLQTDPRGYHRHCRCGGISAAVAAVTLAVLSTLPSGAGQEVGGSTPAAPAPPANLVQERTAFLRSLLEESRLLTEQYERALTKLQVEMAAAAEYEEAGLVQQRRGELKNLFAMSDTTTPDSPAMPLALNQARLSGSVEVRGEDLTAWRTSGAAVEWSNLKITPGRYYLELEANMVEDPSPGRAQPVERAAFDFYEVSLLAGALENRRTFEVVAAANPDEFTAIRVGPVSFSRSPVSLRLAASGGFPRNVIRLRRVQLVPLPEEMIPNAAPPPDSATALKEARARAGADLRAAQGPVITSHLAKLKELGAADPALKAEVEAESGRLRALLNSSEGDPGAFLRMMAFQTGMSGMEDLEGARYIADAANTGDRFLVEHGGRRLLIRLMWVLAAPLDGGGGSAKAFAKHFGIEEEDTPGLARAAQEFTAGYLEGKPLRLLARPATKDRDGSTAALVFLPDVGLYQNVLVDQGLAAVQIPESKSRRSAMERALMGYLQDREQTAKRQRTGAWSLSDEPR